MIVYSARISVLVGGVALLLAACLPFAPSPRRSLELASPLGTEYRCGGLVFPAAAIVGGADPDVLPAEQAALFAALQAETQSIDLPVRPDAWHVLAETDDATLIGQRVDEPGRPSLMTAVLRRQDGDWRLASWESCLPSAVLPDARRAATWTLTERPGRDANLMRTSLWDVDCPGRSVGADRDPVSFIEYGPVAITIVVGVRHGDAPVCLLQGRVASTPFDIALTEPVGDRALVDAGTWPPVDRRAAPEDVNADAQ